MHGLHEISNGLHRYSSRQFQKLFHHPVHLPGLSFSGMWPTGSYELSRALLHLEERVLWATAISERDQHDLIIRGLGFRGLGF